MDIHVVLEKLQDLFASRQSDQVEDYLSEHLKIAMEEQDTGSVLAIVNELIGFYRDTAQFEKALLYCGQSSKLMKCVGMEGTIPYAKGLLNIANVYRACGRWQESLDVYEEVKEIYQKLLAPDNLDFAAYYNNLSLLYQEMNRHEMACEQLEKALAIVSGRQDERIKTAVTHSNLAASLLKCNRTEEAQVHVEEAMKLFHQDEEMDFHYSAAATAAGDLYYHKGDYEKAAAYYEEALMEQEKQVGRTVAYQRILSNLTETYGKLGCQQQLSGMALAEEYYECFGKKMIEEQFPDYVHKIAVGLVGEGSDCLGFDDILSKDHDFGPGFCLWVSDETYEEIGQQLQQAYDSLPKYLHGISRQTTKEGMGRVGVCTIGMFYKRTCGFEKGPESHLEWLTCTDDQLRTATNGKVFRDDEGIFSGIRERLKKGYPQTVFEIKLAQKLALAGQSGQCNYGRMMSRGQVVPAMEYLSIFAKNVMETACYLDGQYPPYGKWLWETVRRNGIVDGLAQKLEKLFTSPADMGVWKNHEPWNGIINYRDEKVLIMEEIASQIVDKLHEAGLTTCKSNYLEQHGQELRRRSEQHMEKEQFVQKIVQMEWKAFDQVKNVGGRASCQDDWETFSIMRTSQYNVWTTDLLQCFYDDLCQAEKVGRNLIMEKYARMMESTAPEEYAAIEDQLPEISEETKQIIDAIVAIQVSWMEAFAEEYPNVGQRARVIHTSEDTLWDTSYETYLRGELSTYSPKTLTEYGRFVAQVHRNGQNLAKLIMEQTVELYGYSSLDDVTRTTYVSCPLKRP